MNTSDHTLRTGLKVLLLCLSSTAWVAQAGEITYPDDSFSSGNTLNASDLNSQFNEIKSDVNDNDSRITINTGDITAIDNDNINHAADPSAHHSAIYSGGDGSAGDLAVSADVDWNITPPTNPYFNNITIDSGMTLTVPAGTTIRCNGTFTNNGTLVVNFGAAIDGNWDLSNGPTMGLNSIAHPGDTTRVATLGHYDANWTTKKHLAGGLGGTAIPQSVAITSFGNFRIGGGSGAGYDNQGARGGGLVKIYCGGAIVNNGTIDAHGENGTNTSIGGGGGGIVILASRTSVDNTAGTIDVSGGSNTSDSTFAGNAGGGGGGIIILASPAAPVTGTEIVSGGTGATGTATVSSTSTWAGSGGGGSGGAGGNGGAVSITGLKSIATDGGVGYTISLTLDPIFMAR